MSTFNARELAASFTVKDITRSVEWYRDTLGFEISEKHEREGKLVAVSMKAGSVRILLGQDNGARGWDRVKGEGFSLQLTTEQDIDAIAERLKSKGTTLASEPMTMPWGARTFSVQDPDGFRLVISSPRTASARS
jgi:uncharacterized glyoxalase superfamily protein PhnB